MRAASAFDADLVHWLMETRIGIAALGGGDLGCFTAAGFRGYFICTADELTAGACFAATS